MATSREDFSFQILTASSSTLDSPPLWRSSTASKVPTDERERHIGSSGKNLSQRSFSCIQETMDSLWEISIDDDGLRSRSSRLDDVSDKFSGLDGQIVKFGCVGAVKKSKRRNGGSNKQAMAIVLKLVKRFFLTRTNSHHLHHHNRAW